MKRTEKAERSETTEGYCDRLPLLSVFSVFSALSALSVLSGCARMEPPPGGPPDAAPPQLIAATPDSFARLVPFRGVAEFQFDEVVSEGGTPNQGEGTGGLEKLIILSPSDRVPEVSWRRSRITVRPREGWRPNRIYRVQLLPGVTDLRDNRTEDGAVITFSTGAPRPETTLQGQVIDWSTSRPAPGALVVASLLPDTLPYRGLADSSGRFSLGPLPQGEYIVSGVLDQDGDHRQDSREAYGTARVARGKTNVGELWAFVHDTNPPRIQTVAVDDSTKATITFSQKLDPRQRFTPRDVRLRLLPDSTPVAVASLLPQHVDDSLRPTPAPPADSAAIRQDTSRTGRRVAPQGRAPAEAQKATRPPLHDRLVLRVPRPWAPGSRMVVEIRGVKNVTGVAANVIGVVAVPEAPKQVPGDSARGVQPADTVTGRQPRDSARVKPRRPPAAPRKK